MTIQVYPEPSSNAPGAGGVVSSGVYGEDGVTTNFTTFQGSVTLPSGFYKPQFESGSSAYTGKVGVGDVYTSAAVTSNALIVASTPGKFKIAAETRWEGQSGPLSGTGVINSLDYYNDYLILSGSRGFATGSTTAAIFITTNNDAWTEVNPIAATVIYNVIYDGTFYIAGHRTDGIIVSTNLVNWTTRTFTASAAAGMGRYAAGSSFFKYAFAGQNAQMIVSTNGTTWTTRATGQTGMPVNVKYLNDKWFTFGSTGRITVSTNGGNNWNLLSTSNLPNTDIVMDMAYGNNTYVAVSLFGNIVWSTDGLNWTTSSWRAQQSTLSAGWQITSVEYSNPYFYTGGAFNGDTYLVSTNGTNWNPLSTTAITSGVSSCVSASVSIPSTSVNFPTSKYYYVFGLTADPNYGPGTGYSRLDGFIYPVATRRRWSKTLNGRSRTDVKGYLEKVSDIDTLTATTT